MRRREDKAIAKHTLNLYAGDYEKLQSLYGTRIGAAKIIRDLVHAHLSKIKARTDQTAELIADIELEALDERSL